MLDREEVCELLNLLTKCVNPERLGSPYQFLHIDGMDEDPILHFWRMYKGGLLDDECFIVFTNIRDTDMWADLEKAFGGRKFGDLFLVRVRYTRNPGVFPSQRGLYME